ncbi:MAG: IS66 family transposase [Methylococcales bacterium]
MDETSLRVDRKNHWISLFIPPATCPLKFCPRKRGKHAMEAIHIIPRQDGANMHDCWASFLAYTHCGHGLCGAHWLRQLTFVIDAHGYRGASALKRLLQTACIRVSKRPEKALSQTALDMLHILYRTILAHAEKELPEFLLKPDGKRAANWPNPMPP